MPAVHRRDQLKVANRMKLFTIGAEKNGNSQTYQIQGMEEQEELEEVYYFARGKL
jgi:hypothetical protein